METKHRKGDFLLAKDFLNISQINWFEVLKSPYGPVLLSGIDRPNQVDISAIGGIQILSGGRKAEYISAYLDNIIPNKIHTEVVASKWQEDAHKSIYQMSGLTPALKVGVGATDLNFHTSKIASDVSIKVDGQQVNRNIASSTQDIKDQLIETFSKERTIGVKSQLAGLIPSRHDAIGVVINPSRVFTTSKISSGEIINYVDSLDDKLLRRSPGSILWPHPAIESHITSINGIERSSAKYPQEYIDLLQHLLGVPTALGLLIRTLDEKTNISYDSSEGNLYARLGLVEKGLIDENEKFIGDWQELVKDRNGDWLILRNARESDYKQMSEIAIRNFRQAPNYAYLQTPEGRTQQEKYIAANTPEGIKDLCNKPNNVCNLVVEKDGKILGFRVIRKNEDVADGRRMHTSLDATDRGIGKILLSKSEKMAKQAGCATMEVHATGNSYAWFERNGFKNCGIRPNNISDYYLMIKEL